MKNLIFTIVVLCALALNCNATDNPAKNTEPDRGKSVLIGTVGSKGKATMTVNQSVLLQAIKKEFKASSIESLQLEQIDGFYFIAGKCNPREGESYGFWIYLYYENNELQLKETSYIHYCEGVKCGSCKLTIMGSGAEGACLCKLHSTYEEDGYCNHSVSGGNAVSTGLVETIRAGLDTK